MKQNEQWAVKLAQIPRNDCGRIKNDTWKSAYKDLKLSAKHIDTDLGFFGTKMHTVLFSDNSEMRLFVKCHFVEIECEFGIITWQVVVECKNEAK